MNDRRLWLFSLFLTLVAVGPVAHAAPDAVFGEWLTQPGDGKIQVGPCLENPALACGRLIWFKVPPDAPSGPPHDANNADPSLRSRSLVGITIVSDFKRAEPGRWVDGKIYDPNDGKTYRSKMSIAANGTLKVAGCVFVFCREQTWTRAN